MNKTKLVMINTLSMIKREMNRRHINGTDLSRLLNLHQSTVVGMLNRSTIQVQKLAELSKALDYNFFREIAEQLPYKEPRFDEANKQKEAILLEEINLLKEVLAECNWNKKESAARLGISRSTLYEKLKKYNITKPTVH